MGYKKDDDNLDNETKKTILEYIQGNPGTYFSEILDVLALKNGTLSYHLYKLEKGGLIKSVRTGMYKRYYPAGCKDVPVSLDSAIYNTVVQNPGITQSYLSKILGLSRQLIYYHIKALVRKGILVTSKKEGRLTLYARPI